jgi:hypothetical protein
MLRTGLLRSKIHLANRVAAASTSSAGSRNGIKASFATYSGDDAKKPTALARIYLEDGTTLTGRSFGCHTSVEGEVVVSANENEHLCLVLGYCLSAVC